MLSLRMEAYAVVPELPPDQEAALAMLEEEVAKVKEGKASTFFASTISADDALIMLNELIWFVRNHLFRERSSSAS